MRNPNEEAIWQEAFEAGKVAGRLETLNKLSEPITKIANRLVEILEDQ